MEDAARDHRIGNACSARAEGERALLRALLLDAIRCLMGEAGPAARRARLSAEARAWVASTDDPEPFSFENVCTWLRLPTDRMRSTLLRLAADYARTFRGRPTLSFGVEERARAERNSSIVALRDAGMRPRELAERFGLSYAAILLICSQMAAGRRAPEALAAAAAG